MRKHVFGLRMEASDWPMELTMKTWTLEGLTSALRH